MFITLPITQQQCNFGPEIELAEQLRWGTHHATLNYEQLKAINDEVWSPPGDSVNYNQVQL